MNFFSQSHGRLDLRQILPKFADASLANASLSQVTSLTSVLTEVFSLDEIYTELLNIASDLIQSEPVERDETGSQIIIIVALSISISRTKQGARHFLGLLGAILLPALGLPVTSLKCMHAELAQCMCHLMWQHGAWDAAAVILHKSSLLLPAATDLAAELAPLLLRLEASVPTREPPAQVRRAIQNLNSLPLSAACHLVRGILQASPDRVTDRQATGEEAASLSHFTACLPGAIRGHSSRGGQETEPGLNSKEAALFERQHFLQALGLKLLLRRMLGMLSSKDESERKAVQHFLLPSCLQAAAVVGGELKHLALSAVWERCRLIIAHEAAGPQIYTVLSVLVQNVSYLIPAAQDFEVADAPMQCKVLDIRTEEEFWALIRLALGSTDSVTCKKGLHLLRAALPPAAAKEIPWSAFLSLYELLDEYSLHLIEEPWKAQIEILHPSESARHGADERHSAGDPSHPELDPDWASLLWQHGFKHPNPQVQRLVVQSFLERDWGGARLKLLTPDLVTTGLLRTVSQPVMLLKGDGSALLQQAERLVSHCMASRPPDQQRSMLEALIESQTVQSLPRATRKALNSCMAAAAEAAGPLEIDTGWFSHIISQLRAVVTTFHFYGSPSLTVDLCKGVMRTAAALGQPPGIALYSVVPLLQELPRDAVREGGSLHQPLRDWLLGIDQSSHAAWYLKGLKSALENFFLDPSQDDAQTAVTPNELAAWKSAADRWACLMMIGAHAEGELKERLLQALEEQTQQLYRRPYLKRGTAERTLVLLYALFDVAGVTAISAGPSATWLLARLESLAGAVAEDLSGYAGAALQYFWTPVQSPRAVDQGMTPFQWSSAASSSLPAEVEASVARARLALECTQLAMLCMLRSAQRTGALTEAAAHAANLLLRLASKFVQCFALTPLPLPGSRRLSEAGELPKHMVDSYTQLQARTLGCMATACGGLAAAACALQSLGHGMAARPNMEAVVQALLRNPLAQITTEAAQQRFTAETETERWRAMEGVLEFASFCDAGACSRSFAGTTRVRILAEVLQALDAAHDDTLITLLRCLRLALAEVVGTPVLLPAAGAALGLQGRAADDGDAARLAAVVGAAARSSWAAVQECRHNARRPAVVAALLDAILLPALCSCDTEETSYRLVVHEDGGPMQWLLGELFAASAKSPQAMAIASVRMCGLWVQRPRIALLYLDFWERLLLFGSTDGGPFRASKLSSEAEFFSDPGNLCIDTDVQEAYAGTEMAARVTAVAALYQLSTEAPTQIQQSWFGGSAVPETTDAERVGRALWQRLLRRAAPHGNLGQPGHYVVGSTMHRSRVRAWQALAVLSRFAAGDSLPDTFRTIWASLQAHNVATVRQYQEAILVELMLRQPELVEEYLLPVLATYEHRWEGLASVVLMSAQVVLHAPKAVQDRLLQPVLTALLPWTLHHHHSLRTFAQLVLQELLERFPGGCGLPANRQLAAVQRFLSVNADLQRLRRSVGAGIAAFNPATATSLRGVFCVGVQMVGRPEDGPGIEGAPAALLERVTVFLAQERAKLRSELDATSTGPQEAVQEASDRQRKANPDSKGTDMGAAAAAAVRNELSAADVVLGDHSASGEPPKDADSKERQGIVVVATLLDKAPNLAGLARTCEVFQASALVMADLRVLKDPAFLSVAMTAEQWVPLLQVPQRDLLPWLLNKQAQGYRMIGLEQTVESQPLPQFEFPERSVLVLGQEGTGIPAHILHALDCCVEIPQLGLVRSLNVHVSGALAVYEYSCQQQRWRGAPDGSGPA